MEGKQLAQYRILEKIGAGGMGEVYRAEDENLRREVAVKVLPPSTLADEKARTRFRQEALALSRINHPGIAMVFDFGSRDGIDYLVMELIPGRTLAEQLAAGRLPEPEQRVLARRIGQGLQAAHDRGIVHRDLKPGNIRVTDEGRVKILDFGLAVIQREGLDRTVPMAEAAVAGTPLYMAPELLEGGVADPRSDLYSFGAVLYEMATGRPPFSGPTPLAVIHAALNRTPDAPREINPDLTPDWERIILQAMARDPEERHPTVRAFLEDLAALEKGEPPAPALPGRAIRSLAVLPLANLSGDPSQEYFADGMTEALIADLVKLGDLQVISRTSSMAYKGVRKPLPEIARELKVDGVIEGSVLRSGERVRITAQLIRARTDTPLWGASYEREIRDVLSLQSEVAEAIADGIQLKLSPKTRARLARPQTIAPEAYEAYLQGRALWGRRTEDALHQAREFFDRAIRLEPGYALGHVGLADTYNVLGFYSYLTPEKAFPRARAAAETALGMEPDLAEAHVSLAYCTHFYTWDWNAAEAGYRRAIELSPNYALAHHWYFNLLVSLGRFEEAMEESRKALDLDPHSLVTRAARGWGYYHRRNFPAAIEACETATGLDPSFAMGWLWKGFACQALGRHKEAVAAFRTADRHALGSPITQAYLAQGQAMAGEKVAAQRILEELTQLRRTRHVPSYLIGLIWLALGYPDNALEWMLGAYEERSHWLVFLNVDPRLDDLRDDPRLEDLIRNVGLPPATDPAN